MGRTVGVIDNFYIYELLQKRAKKHSANISINLKAQSS
jgi:hypothetical protein